MNMNESNSQYSKVKRLFDAGIAHRTAGRLQEARAVCVEALELLNETDLKLLVVVHGELGYICHQLDEVEEAASHYRRAVRAGPRSELASLGLFHSLVDQGEWTSALEEVVRFLGERDSSEYRELLAEGYGDDLPASAQPLVAKARALLAGYAGR